MEAQRDLLTAGLVRGNYALAEQRRAELFADLGGDGDDYRSPFKARNTERKYHTPTSARLEQDYVSPLPSRARTKRRRPSQRSQPLGLGSRVFETMRDVQTQRLAQQTSALAQLNTRHRPSGVSFSARRGGGGERAVLRRGDAAANPFSAGSVRETFAARPRKRDYVL